MTKRDDPALPAGTYAHLPYLRFDPTAEPCIRLDVFGARLEHLPYRSWRELERGGLGGEHERHKIEPRYTRSSPVFVSVTPALAEEQASAAVSRSHLALLLASGRPVPSPSLSITYRTDVEGVSRLIGPLQRDAMIYAEETVLCTIDRRLQARLPRVAAILSVTDATLVSPEIRFALDALSHAAVATMTPAEDAAICAIALEELVMPNERTELTSTFGRRVGVLLEPDPGKADEAERLARGIYAARSDFVHGRVRGGTPNPPVVTRAVLSRAVLYTLAATASGLLRPDAIAGLGLFLDGIRAKPGARAHLHGLVR